MSRPFMEAIPSPEKHVIDIMGIFTLMGVFSEVLPSIVLFLTGIWTILRIYETQTVQKLLGKDKKDGESSDSE